MDVLERARADEVELVELQFSDILGSTKAVAIVPEHLEAALAEGVAFDGSALEGFARAEESDMLLMPIPETYACLPWERDPRVARLLCLILLPDQRPSPYCPRSALERVVAKLGARGFEPWVSAEIEFFLFPRTTPPGPPEPGEHAGYFDLAPGDRGERCRREIVQALRAMGVNVEASHHEVAPGQHEVDLAVMPALAAADAVLTVRQTARMVAERHDLLASFMPKPLVGQNGSGMHLTEILKRGGQNAFDDPAGPWGLSLVGRQFLAGLLMHAMGLSAVICPVVNSYKRLVPGFEAPDRVGWAEHHRSPFVRLPGERGERCRFELRAPDPSANPYLALAATLAAGLSGIESGAVPPNPLPHDHPGEALRLPRDLGEALLALDEDEVVQRAIGVEVAERLIEARSLEWEVYCTQVHPWEWDQYGATF